MSTENMLWFSQRKKLEKMFVQWAQENNAAQTLMNMVAWMMLDDLLNVDAALELIKNRGCI